jgi:class 3 adenylate cyclase
VAYTLEWATPVLPVLAQAAISLSQFDVALHLLDASEEQLLSPLARARTNVCRARLNLEAGNTSGATASLRAALDYFEPANLLAFCREVHRLAPEGSLALRRDLVILYTDIVGSTGLNVALGDQLFLEMLRAHNETVRRRLDRFGGVEFTYTGDGVGARFRSVDAALGFAVGLQAEFDEQNQTREGLPLQVRIGLALGDALEDAGNLFGQTVVRAVRICSFADAGQVFVGAEVAAMADPVAFQLRPAGSVSLKGFGGSHELFDVQPTRAMAASSPGQPM